MPQLGVASAAPDLTMRAPDIWTGFDGGPSETASDLSPETQNSGSQRGLGARIWSGQGQNRTADTTIFSRVLYQLSYLTRRRSARAEAPLVAPGGERT